MTLCFRNSLFITLIYNESTIYFATQLGTVNLPSSPPNYHEFKTFFANSLSFHFRFREFAVYFAKIPWIHCLFQIHHESSPIFPANSIYITLIYHEITFVFLNLVSISRFNYKFIFCFTKFTINQLSLSPIHREQISISRIHCPFREKTIN